MTNIQSIEPQQNCKKKKIWVKIKKKQEKLVKNYLTLIFADNDPLPMSQKGVASVPIPPRNVTVLNIS